MSQKENENDIWDYKPLGKKKKRREPPPETAATKRRCTLRKSSKKDVSSLSLKPQDRNTKAKAAESGDSATAGKTDGYNSLGAQELTSNISPTREANQSDSVAAVGPSSEDFCPICQMPFFILVVQSHRWHVAECLDAPRDTCEECPDGLQCSSTIPNHYKKFNHTLLAHSRANSDTALLSLSQQAEASCSSFPGLIKNEGSILETSQESALTPSALSASPHQHHNGTPQSKRTNGLLLLRSPGPEDFKKKKGWSSSTKSQNSITASQESFKEDLSIPDKEDSGEQASEDLCKSKDSSENDDMISFSPLSEFPTETEVNECRKALFSNDAIQNEDEDSMTLFSDSFSSEDELLTEFINSNSEGSNVPGNNPSSTNTQLGSVSSLAPTNQLAAATVATNRAASTGGKEAPEISKPSIQSPQSIVLERLRDTLLSSDNSHPQNLNDGRIQTEQRSSLQVPSSPSSIVQRSQTMPPQKGQSKAGQVSGLKQTDIGVFFGLTPLKEKKKEAESGPNDLNTASISTAGKSSGQRRQRKDRQRKNKVDTAADMTQATETVDSLVQGEAERGGTRFRRRRWNRGNADGEVELPRCPFYKKIPGTKFAIDAFRYGEIEGITAYFLTHFHSDHYGGLTKTSTLPIYCNRITGNLVKSKLRVEEQYVHILPMNTEVTVEGVRVILLDANHCPGAAMLLFFLPDGQTVLHTGDFRADPSMETYPELLSSRVQTLYLDTTYCSPEYTFPRQQEVINFAASTAFELVTLNPRTLVVCGSYSVGKEKVFLALAEVLGSKVCLSRDKYNTMCCLESEQIKARLTTNWKAAQVHVLPMMQLSFNKLQDHLARFSQQYDQLVAFKPTGWTFSQQVDSVEDIQPQISGNISIYGIPYSEHSSFLELKRFVQWLQPLKIIPTVNNGSWANRRAMEKCFSEWLTETKNKW
ncbi:DNA cross-link repair 1A protein [Archocentrus centrarchus]|uniref:DNA cross-link repair 1A protein n=1 Tax=Archocentrus centrarchus TaxID=63155 RepID=UPI0011E9BA8F|nr:DNA cross-link repair 1A protein [Archocentrus centrarchus]